MTIFLILSLLLSSLLIGSPISGNGAIVGGIIGGLLLFTMALAFCWYGIICRRMGNHSHRLRPVESSLWSENEKNALKFDMLLLRSRFDKSSQARSTSSEGMTRLMRRVLPLPYLVCGLSTPCWHHPAPCWHHFSPCRHHLADIILHPVDATLYGIVTLTSLKSFRACGALCWQQLYEGLLSTENRIGGTPLSHFTYLKMTAGSWYGSLRSDELVLRREENGELSLLYRVCYARSSYWLWNNKQPNKQPTEQTTKQRNKPTNRQTNKASSCRNTAGNFDI